MKCEKCGKEANFYYRSNINGKVTTMNLCSECAEKSGDIMNMDSVFDNMYNDMFNMFGSMLSPMTLSPWSGFGLGMPTMSRPRFRITLEPVNENGEAVKTEPETKAADRVDPEMSKRRELNMLREQMNMAVRNEEFEKAAELRDRIKELNNGTNL